MSPLERTCSLVRSIVNLVFSGAAQTCCMRIRTQRRVKLVWHRHSYHVPPSDISLSFPAYDFRQIKSALACASLYDLEHKNTLKHFSFSFFFFSSRTCSNRKHGNGNDFVDSISTFLLFFSFAQRYFNAIAAVFLNLWIVV